MPLNLMQQALKSILATPTICYPSTQYFYTSEKNNQKKFVCFEKLTTFTKKCNFKFNQV